MQRFDKILLDYDGVLLDSEERIVKMKGENPDISWDDFFDTLDWESLYDESLEINDSMKILREYQKKESNLDDTFIISKTHTLDEGRFKLKRLRREGILIPMFIVPPHVKKSEIFIPTMESLLVDDSMKNIKEWTSHGGAGYLFDPEDKHDAKQKVKSLEFLLRR